MLALVPYVVVFVITAASRVVPNVLGKSFSFHVGGAYSVPLQDMSTTRAPLSGQGSNSTLWILLVKFGASGNGVGISAIVAYDGPIPLLAAYPGRGCQSRALTEPSFLE
ncbi:hypothetical protein BS17DRAFT_311997 [Gyrodon lividus]|nr:hypothetical protein BS17DRAFT_311997 [Gyrodon lividus]